jgi:hypothetical protein
MNIHLNHESQKWMLTRKCNAVSDTQVCCISFPEERSRVKLGYIISDLLNHLNSFTMTVSEH